MSAYRQFLSMLERFPPGSVICIDDIRAEVDAAQWNNHEKGQVWKDACRAGLLIDTDRSRPSTHPPAKRRRIQIYLRTSEPVRRAA